MITYSDHARRRLHTRHITRREVKWLLARGERTAAPTYMGRQRWSVRGYLGRHEAEVIFLEDARQLLIITVQWIRHEQNEPWG